MAAKCPLCGKPANVTFKPFCSKRCADLDLNQWFKGGYAIPEAPGSEPPVDPGENDPDGDDG